MATITAAEASASITSSASQIATLPTPANMQRYLMEGLEGVERLQYHGAKPFNKTIHKLITEFQPGGAAPYVVFSPVTQEQLTDIDRICQRRFKGLRFMYLNDGSTLIIKVIVDLPRNWPTGNLSTGSRGRCSRWV